MHIWSVLGSRFELKFYFEIGKHRECAGILVQNEVHGEKYSNKAVQADNLRGVVCVHARCAPIVAHKRHRINCG